MNALPADVAAKVAQIAVDACAERDAMTPREAAEAAYCPGGPSLDELEHRIRADRERRRTGAA